MIASRGAPEEGRVTIQAGRAARLRVAGAVLEIPADALEPGTAITLTTTPVGQGDFPRERFPEEAVLTEIITVAASTAQHGTIPLQLSIKLPRPPATFFARIKSEGASPHLEGATDWNLAFGDFEPATSTLRFQLLGTAVRDSVIVVTREAGGAAPSTMPPPRKSSVQEHAFLHRAVEAIQVQLNSVAGWVADVAPSVVPTATAQGNAGVPTAYLDATNFVTVCDPSLACDPASAVVATGLNAIATTLVEVGKFFAGPELAFPGAALFKDTKANLVRSGLRGMI
jgi:hypothetical protein